MNERERLEQAIATLEAQREILGHDVTEAAIKALQEKIAALESEPKPSPEQRKLVTVLFADITGFTALSERLDAEVVNNVINALWLRLDKVIIENGGHIDKHIGDAVMALWGSHVTREDDPERAIRAALAMQREVSSFQVSNSLLSTTFDTETLENLHIRIGIHTGPVILGEVGTMGEYTAIGDTVNTANRLENAAPIDGILISHDTYRHVRGIFDVQPKELIRLKGKTEPLQTYIIQRAKERAFRVATRGVEGIETRMVGRSMELQKLQDAFWQTMESNRTGYALVTGEAGMGKSRLLYEFDNWIELLPVEIFYFKGRAIQAMINTPFGIIRDMFAYRFDIFEVDSVTTVLEKFRTGTSGILDADQADLVGHLVGFDFSSSQAVQNLLGSPYFGQMARAYLHNYLKSIGQNPTVIFLEDIHWADDSSLGFFQQLLNELTDGQLFIVSLARPSLFERYPQWIEKVSGCVHIDLYPLSKNETQALVDEILQKVDKIPDSLRDMIVKGTEGNPFYVEEMIKMLIDDGVIVRGDDHWSIVLEKLKKTRVPLTLAGVLQARLDSLSNREREVLQRASVVGRLFWDSAVGALHESPRDSYTKDLEMIRKELRTLERRELVFKRERSVFAGTNECIFKHVILHEVTYDTVLLKLRQIYHMQVAQWLEANAGERISEYLGQIATHYELAGERVTAARYLFRSGDELIKVSAFHEAIKTFERALAMLPDKEAAQRSTLLVKLGYAYGRVGDYTTAVKYLEEGLPLARAAGDRKAEVAALNELGRVNWDKGEYEAARCYLDPGLSLAREENDQEGMALALWSLGCVSRYQGENDAAVSYLEQSLEISRRLGDRHGIANTLIVLGMVAFGLGAYEEADRYYAEGLAIFREIGERRGVFVCLYNLGVSARKQGDYEKARENFEEILPIGKEIGLQYGIAVCLVGLGMLHIDLEDDNNAWDYLRKSLKKALSVDAIPYAVHALVGIARLHLRQGQHEQAAEMLGLALSHSAATVDARQEAEAVLARLNKALSAEQLECALQRGETLHLESVIHEIIESAE